MDVLATDIDNHADTHCFGKNFVPFSWTDLVCSVSPFLSEYTAVEDIRICSGATAYTTNDGETVVLIFGQGLWFGDRMDRSLINPNQCRAYGVGVCDDPTDPYRQLGFYHDDEFFPMQMNGSIAVMNTRRPTRQELDECRKFYFSDPDFWDPSNVTYRDVRQVDVVSSTPPVITAIPPFTDLTSTGLRTRLISSIAVDRPVSQTSQMAPLPLSKFGGKNVITSNRHHAVTPELLAKKWGCGLQTARNTLRHTTQFGVRSAIGPLTRRYRTDLLQLHHTRLNTTIYTDTMFAKVKSLKGHTCAQVFTDGKGFIHAIPMKSKKDAGTALRTFIQDFGIPRVLAYDGAKEQVGPGTEFQKSLRAYHIKDHTSEPDTPNQNRAEAAIRELKRRWKQRIMKRRVPKRLWDFGITWEGEILSRLCRHNNDYTGIERLTGDTVDISEWIEFEFYDLCWYWEVPDDGENPLIGRWLGVSHRVGSAMCYWILTSKGTVVSRTTVQHVTKEDVLNEEIMDNIRQFHLELDSKLGDELLYINNDSDFSKFLNEDVPDPSVDNPYEDRVNDGTEEPYQGYRLPEIDEIGNIEDEREAANVYDAYIGAEIPLPGHDNQNQMARVVKRIKGNDGNSIDASKPYNPILDTSEYLVEFSDGTTKELTANLIAESMYSQVDDEGHHFQLLKEISDHRKDDTAIEKKDGYFQRSSNSPKVPKKTTRGWQLLVHWKDGSSQWIKLKDLKVSNPVELAEYAKAKGIDDEPAFKWWVPFTLHKRDRIVKKVKAKYWRTTHMLGIRVPKSVDEALKLDEENGNTLWYDAIQKEMTNVRVAFKVDDDVTVEQARSNKFYVGYQEIKCHMIFTIKMDGKFTRKARLVAGGHTTNTPSAITYSSVVSRDTVRIAFVIAALNGLDVSSCDIGNAYLNAPCREKIWCVAGTEFGSDKGKVLQVVRALYGLKSSGASWRAMFAQTLNDFGYQSSKADPDLWYKPKTKPNGDEYYSYILVYVDDVLHFDHEPNILMAQLESIYRLKDKAEAPDRYLGANIDKVQLQDGSIAWSMSSREYLTNAIKNLDKQLEQDKAPPLRTYGKKSGERPFPVSYRPEIDTSPALGDELTTRYMQLIGILRWGIEIGRLDIITEVSVLSQHQCSPREGHLDAVYRIFWYLKCSLKKKQEGRIVFDATQPIVDESLFNSSDTKYWDDFYPDAEEAIPPNMIPPRGHSVQLACYVDADHAGNLMTRRSHSGILLYINNTPVIWYSKRQNTVESSSFGSEFVALRIATEMIEALRYKLRMFGVPISGSTDVFCDNKSVVTNASIPSSVLNKKHNSICYHRVREAQAAGTIRVGWIEGEYNKADLATKTTLSTVRRHGLTSTLFDNNCTILEKEKFD